MENCERRTSVTFSRTLLLRVRCPQSVVSHPILVWNILSLSTKRSAKSAWV
jgi:hypothetical protein